MSNPIQRGNHNAFSEGQNLYVLYEVDEAQINLGNFEEEKKLYKLVLKQLFWMTLV